MTTLETPRATSLPEFRNEPYADFSVPGVQEKAAAALAEVRRQFGHEYDVLVAGRRVRTGNKLRSINPSHTTEIVGIHSKADAALANEAVESAW